MYYEAYELALLLGLWLLTELVIGLVVAWIAVISVAKRTLSTPQ